MNGEKSSCGPVDHRPAHGFLTVRDHFAGLAMSGLLAAGRDAQYGDTGMTNLVRSSYQIADAMLKAREA